MKRLAPLVTALVLTASNCPAEPMLKTQRLPCRAIADIVANRGAVLLATGGDDFDRYVSDQSQCVRDQELTPAWVKSADNASCFVGYTCEYHPE